MYVNGKYFYLDRCSFVDCYSIKGDGGSLFFNSDNATVLNSLFVNSSAGDCGGAIEFDEDYSYGDNCTFVNCTANKDGQNNR